MLMVTTLLCWAQAHDESVKQPFGCTTGLPRTKYDWAMDDPGLAVEHFIFAGSCEVHLK